MHHHRHSLPNPLFYNILIRETTGTEERIIREINNEISLADAIKELIIKHRNASDGYFLIYWSIIIPVIHDLLQLFLDY